MAVAKSVHTTDKIKVTQTAYDLAMKLFAAQANKKPVPVTKEMLASKLSELTDKKKNIALRQGQSPGRFGKPGTVKLLVAKTPLNPYRIVRHVERLTSQKAIADSSPYRSPHSKDL